MTRIVQICEALFGAGSDLALRSAVVLALVSVVTLFLRRSSSAVRHLVWSTALVGVLLLPVVWAVAPVQIVLPISDVRSAIVDTPIPIAESGKHLEGPLLASAAAEIEASRSLEPLEFVEANRGKPPLVTTSTPAASPGLQINWRVLAVGTWLVGAIVLTLPLLLGGFSVYRLQRASQPFSVLMTEELRELARLWLGGRRVVGLLSHTRTMPMTWGVLRPVVLLPIEAADWPTERRRVVLLHEMAHIRRRDCLFQMIGQLVRALHWFNPLAWWASSQLRLEQEKACDDAVLNTGTHADEYAAELLSVSARLPQFTWEAAVALAMSRVTRLEHRLKAILDMHNNRRPLSKRSVALSLTVLSSLVFAVSVIQRHEVQGASPPVREVAALDNPEPQPQATTTTSPTAAPKVSREDSAVQPVIKKDSPESPTTTKEPPAATIPAPRSSGVRLNVAAKTIESHSLITVNETVLSEAAIRGMLKTLQDPYSTFIPADELKQLYEQIEGQLVGIGAALKGGGKDEPIVVELLIPNSPAILGGLKVGDEIITVNGQSFEKLADAVKAIRGPAGTEVSLKIRRGEKEESTLTLKRGQVRLLAPKGLSISDQGQWQYWLDGTQKLGYVQLSEFNSTAATDLKATLKTLNDQGLKGLVLDLRGNPGGMLTAVIEVAQLFLKDALVVQTRGRASEGTSYKVGPEATYPTLPLIVLIDRDTGSAAEVLAAALKDNDRVTVIGERTFGKGSVQSIFPLDNNQGPAVKLTTAQMLTPKGRQLSRQPDSKEWGVDPHDGFYIPLTAEQRTARQSKRLALQKGSLQPKEPLTPEFVEQQLSDPALAAAWKSLLSKVLTGEFTKTGQPLSDQEVQFAKQAEVRKQRDELRKKVEQLDRELGEVPLGIAR